MGADLNPFIGYAYASDWDKQWKAKDPVLFPHQASQEVLKKWPPFIAISAEYDLFDPCIQDFAVQI